jgi:hypothetical protein
MFQQGIRYDWKNGTRSVIDVQTAAVLKLPTGRITGQDPGCGTHPVVKPFTVAVQPGCYPVTLSFSRWDEPPGISVPMRLVNAVKLIVQNEPVAFWELASRQEPAPSDDGEFFGFAAGTGTGCFMDAAARGQLGRLQADQDLWKKAARDIVTRGCVDIPTGDPDLNVIVFSRGMGGGSYPTWVGRAASGAAVCLVADLELLRHSFGPARPGCAALRSR